MANLTETSQWEAGIYQLETTDPVLGGPPNLALSQGFDNVPHQLLANRTTWLKTQVEAIQQTLTDLTNGAPGALDTLNELASALGDDPNFAATITAMLSAASPVGGEMFFAGDTPPTGWLEEDRSEISRTSYAALWAHAQASGMYDATGANIYMFGPGDGSTTFHLPESRGEFLRAWDHSRNADPSRALGDHQGDAIRNIVGNIGTIGVGGTTDGAFAISGLGGALSNTGESDQQANFNAGRVVPVAAENRPRNVSRMFCIKY